MKNYILGVLLLFVGFLNAQVDSVLTQFYGSVNVAVATNNGSNYDLQMFYNHTASLYSSEDAQVGDFIYLPYNNTCVRFKVESFSDKSGGIINATVSDVDNKLNGNPFQTGVGAIIRETENYSFPLYVDGIDNNLLQCIRTHFTLLVDRQMLYNQTDCHEQNFMDDDFDSQNRLEVTINALPGSAAYVNFFKNGQLLKRNVHYSVSGNFITSLVPRNDTDFYQVNFCTAVSFLDDKDEQSLELNGNQLSITNGNVVDLSSLSGNEGTDDQNLSLSGNTLGIENGTGVDLPEFSSELFQITPDKNLLLSFKEGNTYKDKVKFISVDDVVKINRIGEDSVGLMNSEYKYVYGDLYGDGTANNSTFNILVPEDKNFFFNLKLNSKWNLNFLGLDLDGVGGGDGLSSEPREIICKFERSDSTDVQIKFSNLNNSNTGDIDSLMVNGEKVESFTVKATPNSWARFIWDGEEVQLIGSSNGSEITPQNLSSVLSEDNDAEGQSINNVSLIQLSDFNVDGNNTTIIEGGDGVGFIEGNYSIVVPTKTKGSARFPNSLIVKGFADTVYYSKGDSASLGRITLPEDFTVGEDRGDFTIGNDNTTLVSVEPNGNTSIAGNLSVATAPVEDNEVVRKIDLEESIQNIPHIFTNGITEGSKIVKLGGPLTEATDIQLDDNTISFTEDGTFAKTFKTFSKDESLTIVKGATEADFTQIKQNNQGGTTIVGRKSVSLTTAISGQPRIFLDGQEGKVVVVNAAGNLTLEGINAAPTGSATKVVGVDADDNTVPVEVADMMSGGVIPASATGKTLTIEGNLNVTDTIDPVALEFSNNPVLGTVTEYSIGIRDGLDLNVESDSQPNILHIENNGNVGIGTDNPDSKLDVDGDVRITGNIIVDDGSQLEGEVLTTNADGKGEWRGLHATSFPTIEGLGSGIAVGGTLKEDYFQQVNVNPNVVSYSYTKSIAGNGDDTPSQNRKISLSFGNTDSTEVVVRFSIQGNFIFFRYLGEMVDNVVLKASESSYLEAAWHVGYVGASSTLTKELRVLHTSNERIQNVPHISNNALREVGTGAVADTNSTDVYQHEGSLNVGTTTAEAGYNLQVQGKIWLEDDNDNAIIGSNSGKDITTGKENVFVGGATGFSATTANFNTFVGFQTGLLNNGFGNTFVGYKAGRVYTGNNNTFFGYNAGLSTTTGTQNIFMGVGAGGLNTTGFGNVFIGYNAGISNISGKDNVFLGYRAGDSNTTGQRNLFQGFNAGAGNTTGSFNTFQGFNAGLANEDGSSNIYIGNSAGIENISGVDNLMIGKNAGRQAQGSNNVFLGKEAGFFETGSNKLYISNTNTNTPLIGGDFSTQTMNVGGVIVITVPTDPATSPNGSFFLGTDGAWYVRGAGGTLTQIGAN